ncbi:hypothetical protein [Pseudomonas huanghezhanensis]|uniref:hypothetical protein n=1 Tax=Pseudomonas huanghezhanensis TaxID=3002903 RepID=UPI002285C5A7|nr:hypothetical protein [Pseudomonas sp. BSw22131]
MITNISASALSAPRRLTEAEADTSTQNRADKTTAVVDKSDNAAFSTFARQLGGSAMRAELREKTMSYEELNAFALQQVDKFSGNNKELNDASRAREIPVNDDHESVSRARNATDYITRLVAGDTGARNPFERLSRDELTLIAYDDKGNFTLNERRAAYEGIGDLEQRWRQETVERGNAEQARIGRSPQFFADVLDHYKSLPAIEKALSYPKATVAVLEDRIYNEHFGPGMPEREVARRTINLYEVLAGITLPDRPRSNDPLHPSHNQKFSARTSAIAAEAAFEKLVDEPTRKRPS